MRHLLGLNLIVLLSFAGTQARSEGNCPKLCACEDNCGTADAGNLDAELDEIDACKQIVPSPPPRDASAEVNGKVIAVRQEAYKGLLTAQCMYTFGQLNEQTLKELQNKLIK